MAQPKRTELGQFPSGVSGNPNGRKKGWVVLDQAILDVHGPNVLPALTRLLDIGMTGLSERMDAHVGKDGVVNERAFIDGATRVRALTEFLKLTKGVPSARSREVTDEAPVGDIRELMERVLQRPEARSVVLELIAGGKE